jgi:4a-hydroxytetrahydrobiopterin dehydratase
VAPEHGLADEHCLACRPGAPAADPAEMAGFLEHNPHWQVIEQDSVPQLRRLFRFKNYAQALEFTNQIARLAIAEDHHPALLLEWGRVTVTWWTHAIRGLHRNDLIMAAKTERLYTLATPQA